MSTTWKRTDSRPSSRYTSNSGRGGSRSNTRGGYNGRNGGSNNSNRSSQVFSSQSALPMDATSAMETYDSLLLEAEIDRNMGFDLYDMGPAKVGWLINMHSVCIC